MLAAGKVLGVSDKEPAPKLELIDPYEVKEHVASAGISSPDSTFEVAHGRSVGRPACRGINQRFFDTRRPYDNGSLSREMRVKFQEAVDKQTDKLRPVLGNEGARWIAQVFKDMLDAGVRPPVKSAG